MILTAVIASLIGAVVVMLVVPPRYKASTRVMLDIIKPDPVTGEVIANQFLRAYTKTQTELIRDYKVAGPVVDELGWTRDPEMLARYDVAGDTNGARRRMAQVIIDNTKSELIEGSNILEISYTGYSPDAAKAVADSIRRSYLDATLAFKRESASDAADWFQGQTEKARRLLAIAEDNKAKFERKHGLILQPDKNDVDSVRLAALSTQQSVAVGGGFAPAVTSSPSGAQLAQLDAQIAQARQTMGPNHPTIREAVQRRALLSAQVQQERAAAGAANAAARSAAAASGAAAGSNRRDLSMQRARVLANRENLSVLRQLQDEVDLRREQYVKAAGRLADLRLQGDVSAAGLTVLGNAVAPEDAAFPNIPLLISGALGFGLALGVLSALLAEMLNRRVRSATDMEEAAENIPLLAVVSSASQEPRRTWLQSLRLRLSSPSPPEPASAW